MTAARRAGALLATVALLAAACSGSSSPEGDDGPGSGTGTPPPAGRRTTTDESARLFDMEKVHEVTLDLTPEALADLEADWDRQVPARLRFDGTEVAGVGLRIKQGLGSRRGLSAKAGFSIETDEFVDGQTLYGVERFSLGNAVQDPSFVSEHVAYEAFRAAGVAAPRTAFANVRFDGELFGVYVLRETIDENFLRRNFLDGTGNLYEGSMGFDITDVAAMQPQTNQQREDRSDLERLARVVAETSDDRLRTALGELVDLDRLLTYWAVEALVHHWDGYAVSTGPPGSPNNYFAYHDPSLDRFVFLPWGADQTLSPAVPAQHDPATPVVSPPHPAARLAARLYALPETPARLGARVVEVLDTSWDVGALVARLDHAAALVRGTGLTATREETTPEAFEGEVAVRRSYLAGRAAAVRAEVATL